MASPPIAAPFDPGVKHYVDLPRTCDATRSAGAVLTDEGQKLMIPCFSQLARLVQQVLYCRHSELLVLAAVNAGKRIPLDITVTRWHSSGNPLA